MHTGNVRLVGRVGVAEGSQSLVAYSMMVSADRELKIVVDMDTVWA